MREGDVLFAGLKLTASRKERPLLAREIIFTEKEISACSILGESLMDSPSLPYQSTGQAPLSAFFSATRRTRKLP